MRYIPSADDKQDDFHLLLPIVELFCVLECKTARICSIICPVSNVGILVFDF